MDQSQAVELARRYADLVVHELSPEQVYLFGSYAKDCANLDSDIDVAVVFNGFVGDWLRTYTRLASLTRLVSADIEPVMLDMTHDRSGFVTEIMNTGQLLYQRAN